MRIFRFTSSASTFLDDLESGQDIETSTQDLQRRLVDAGAIHPVPVADVPVDLDDVTILIPAHVDDPTALESLLESLPKVASVIVLDDGSPSPLERTGNEAIVRHDRARGPAAARNRALDLVDTAFVLFLDSDIDLPSDAGEPDFWGPLKFHMADPRMAVVAPRVRSVPGASVRERYEVERSPLDMGPTPARVASGSRISYVPSAALLVRMDVFRSLGGFEETLRYGEDVDFVWRANDAGHVCRYEPSVVVGHTPRPTWLALFEQRFRYGTAAAPLESRHPGATRPVRMSRWSAIALAATALGHPLIALGVASSSIVRLARRLQTLPDRWLLACRLAGLGHLLAGRAVLASAVRSWWPLTVAMCIASRRARFIVSGYLAARTAALAFSDRESSLDPLRTSCLEAADDIAYGSGVWFAAISKRNVRSLAARLD